MPSPKTVVFPKKIFVTLKERHENLYNKKSEPIGNRKKAKKWTSEMKQILVY